MHFDYYDKLIDKRTRIRCDITPLFNDPDVFNNLLNDMSEPFLDLKVDKVVGLDALGFILGSPISRMLNAGFVPIRKEKKLSRLNHLKYRTHFTDYSGNKKIFEINRDAIGKDERVLIVDDWIETGSQARAAIRLIEKCGGKIVGITSICAHRFLGTETIFEKYNCRALKIKPYMRKR